MEPQSTILLAFLLLVTSPVDASTLPDQATVDARCPSPCSCQVLPPRIVQADCSAKSLDDIPISFHNATSRLILNDNPLRTLSKYSLQSRGLENIKDFYCSRCDLQHIDESAFLDVTSLHFIDLSFNNFDKFSTTPFKTLKHLKVLMLTHNAGLNCHEVTREFKTVLSNVVVKCDNDNYRTKRTPIEDDEAAFIDAVFNFTGVNATEKTRLLGDDGDHEKSDKNDDGDWVSVTTPEDSSWGVGTYIVLAILVVIICLVCFKFVFLKLRKRWKKRAREAAWREQDVEDEEREREDEALHGGSS